jgi:hypothetical protein
MLRHRPFVFAGLLFVLGAVPAHGLIINLDGRVHAVGTGVDQPVAVLLPADNYVVTPVGVAGGGAYDAFSPWDSNSNCTPSCTPSGTNHGWLHRYAARIGTTVIIDPNATWNGLAYANPLDALAASIPSSFSLPAPATVEFYIPTGAPLTDNRGGISLELLTPLSPRSDTWGRIKLLYR